MGWLFFDIVGLCHLTASFAIFGSQLDGEFSDLFKRFVIQSPFING